jgi:hypothetical protein
LRASGSRCAKTIRAGVWAGKDRDRPVSGFFARIIYVGVMNFIPVKVSTLYIHLLSKLSRTHSKSSNNDFANFKQCERVILRYQITLKITLTAIKKIKIDLLLTVPSCSHLFFTNYLLVEQCFRLALYEEQPFLWTTSFKCQS